MIVNLINIHVMSQESIKQQVATSFVANIMLVNVFIRTWWQEFTCLHTHTHTQETINYT